MDRLELVGPGSVPLSASRSGHPLQDVEWPNFTQGISHWPRSRVCVKVDEHLRDNSNELSVPMDFVTYVAPSGHALSDRQDASPRGRIGSKMRVRAVLQLHRRQGAQVAGAGRDPVPTEPTFRLSEQRLLDKFQPAASPSPSRCAVVREHHAPVRARPRVRSQPLAGPRSSEARPGRLIPSIPYSSTS